MVRLGIVDSATVWNAEGSGVTFRKGPQQFRALRTVVLYRRLVAECSVTAERYHAAVPELTSVDSWEQTLKVSDRIAGSVGDESEW